MKKLKEMLSKELKAVSVFRSVLSAIFGVLLINIIGVTLFIVIVSMLVMGRIVYSIHKHQ